jgi:hypothetical protein
MLKRDAKRDYQRQYMRKKSAGKQTRPMMPGRPSGENLTLGARV